MKKSFLTQTGTPTPLGATVMKKGVNFALFSEHATEVTLCLFAPDEEPLATFTLDQSEHETGYIWHIFVEDLPEEFTYGYKVNGPKELRYTPELTLIDPYAKELNASHEWGAKRAGKTPTPLLGKISPSVPFDWEEDELLQTPWEQTIIYELHVRGFTQHTSNNKEHRGTFLGIIEKIPYLKEIGITAIELLPIHAFDECEYHKKDPISGNELFNFWGYSTINFFSPMARYATSSQVGLEIKQMVKELHKAGIEVILDVVYNHTAEWDHQGPTYSFRGIDDEVYYLLDESGNYLNYSGCGNVLRCNHAVVAQMIIDSLKYWVDEYHIDGFRFDLASILTRGEDGAPLDAPFLIQAISQDPILGNVKLIAEAWDAGGLYQVGNFPSWGRWAEWNGKYRDRVRTFIKGTDGAAGDFAQSLSGSKDLYGHDRKPYHSVNFITSHDGFTLRDLVSYDKKHNHRNGEENRDGDNHNNSWNCGAEGITDHPEIEALREKQIRNFFTALFLSLGTPMVWMGDEYGHTRHGNNNTWCHDDELNWFLWESLEHEKELFRFYKLLINFRRNELLLQRKEYPFDEELIWHGHEPFEANWGDESHFVAYTLNNQLYVAFNAHSEPAPIRLPEPMERKKWFRIIDTSKPSPDDFVENPQALSPMRENYVLEPYSSLVLKSY